MIVSFQMIIFECVACDEQLNKLICCNLSATVLNVVFVAAFGMKLTAYDVEYVDSICNAIAAIPQR